MTEMICTFEEEEQRAQPRIHFRTSDGTIILHRTDESGDGKRHCPEHDVWYLASILTFDLDPASV